MNDIRTNSHIGPLLPATASACDLVGFPLGSLESRAATRSLLAAREAMRGEGMLFRLSVIGSSSNPHRLCRCKEAGDGSFRTLQVLAMRPGDFALGSEKSRAAARQTAEQRKSGRDYFMLIDDLNNVTEPSSTPWVEGKDGVFSCIFALPDGMTLEEAKRIVEEKQPGWRREP